MTTRQLINEMALDFTKILTLMAGQNDQVIDALFGPMTVEYLHQEIRRLFEEAQEIIDDRMFQQHMES